MQLHQSLHPAQLDRAGLLSRPGQSAGQGDGESGARTETELDPPGASGVEERRGVEIYFELLILTV